MCQTLDTVVKKVESDRLTLPLILKWEQLVLLGLPSENSTFHCSLFAFVLPYFHGLFTFNNSKTSLSAYFGKRSMNRASGKSHSMKDLIQWCPTCFCISSPHSKLLITCRVFFLDVPCTINVFAIVILDFRSVKLSYPRLLKLSNSRQGSLCVSVANCTCFDTRQHDHVSGATRCPCGSAGAVGSWENVSKWTAKAKLYRRKHVFKIRKNR